MLAGFINNALEVALNRVIVKDFLNLASSLVPFLMIQRATMV